MVRLAVLGSGWNGSHGWVCIGIEVGCMTYEPTAVQPGREIIRANPTTIDVTAIRERAAKGEGLNRNEVLDMLAAVRELIARAEVAESIAERLDDGWAPDFQARQWLKITGWETEHIQPMTDAEVAWLEARRTSDTKGEADG